MVLIQEAMVLMNKFSDKHILKYISTKIINISPLEMTVKVKHLENIKV